MTSQLQRAIGLSKPPIAIGFLDEPPAGLDAWNGGAVPAGCSFWRAAMDGRSFYTIQSEHLNCAVGAYTHAIGIPAERGPLLADTIGFMVGNGYLRMEEVPSIPVLPKAPRFVAYAPVGEGEARAGFQVDVVVMAARPASAMLVYEAALRSGAADGVTQTLGRPGCAVLPLTVKSGRAAVSFGCRGNRTFTGLPDDELYIAIPGAKWADVVAAAEEIVAANAAMGAHYKAREAAVSES
jgi:uncharacterized protein (DUF169 family)